MSLLWGHTMVPHDGTYQVPRYDRSTCTWQKCLVRYDISRLCLRCGPLCCVRVSLPLAQSPSATHGYSSCMMWCKLTIDYHVYDSRGRYALWWVNDDRQVIQFNLAAGNFNFTVRFYHRRRLSFNANLKKKMYLLRGTKMRGALGWRSAYRPGTRNRQVTAHTCCLVFLLTKCTPPGQWCLGAMSYDRPSFDPPLISHSWCTHGTRSYMYISVTWLSVLTWYDARHQY